MVNSHLLRPIRRSDHGLVRDIYAESIQSQGEAFYSLEQIQAWSALAWLPSILDSPLNYGTGWLSMDGNEVAAFAVRYPSNRLALVYCRGCFSRRGHGTSLLNQVEIDARDDHQKYLITEASLFGYQLFLSLGWTVEKPERIMIGGVKFDRFCMKKLL